MPCFTDLIRLHNVGGYTPLPDGSLRLQRIPENVRVGLNPKA